MNFPDVVRRAAVLPAIAFAATLWLNAPAAAQTSIVALVNNVPITSTEVAERRVVVRLVRKQELSAKAALEELIDQRVLMEEGKRRGVSVDENDVEQRFAGVAANANMTPDQLGKALSQAGASARGFKQEIRVGLLKRRLGGMLSRLSTGVSEKEIAAGITAKKSTGGTNYTLQQIVFVTPKDAKPGVINQRKSEAENFRRRIQSCEQGIAMSKELRDVAARPQVVRLGGQMPKPFRDQIDALKVGQSTKADRTDLGVEIIVLCNKQEVADDSALRNEVQNQLIAEQGEEEVDKFVADLRRRALVIYR